MITHDQVKSYCSEQNLTAVTINSNQACPKLKCLILECHIAIAHVRLFFSNTINQSQLFI